jgi:hypothetical protein
MTSLDKEGIVKVSGVQWKTLLIPQKKFEDLVPRSFKRKTLDKNIYDIYSDKEKFETIESESVLSSINEGKVKSPYKIVNINCRIPDVIHADELELISEEFVENNKSLDNELKTIPVDPVEPVAQSDENPQQPESESSASLADSQ